MTMEKVDLTSEIKLRAICAICGKSILPTAERPFKTFSLGNEQETATVFGIVMFCPEHLEHGNALAVVRQRAGPYAGQITAALAQWDLPDGTNCPVFCYGVIQYDDGRTEARIVPIDSVEPLCVPVEQVALYKPPSS